jgi:hypothetical protein
MPIAGQRCFSSRGAPWAGALLSIALACDDYRDEAPPTLREGDAGRGGTGAVSGAGSGAVADTGSAGSAGSSGIGPGGSTGPDAGSDAAAGANGASGVSGSGGVDAGAEGGDAAGSDATGDGPAGKDAGADGSDGGACAESWVIEYRLHGDPPPGPPLPVDRTVFRSLVQNIDIKVGDHTDPIWQCLEGGQNCLGVGPGRLRLRFADAGGVPGDGKVTLVSYENRYDFELAFIETRLTVDADGLLPPSPPSRLEPNHPAPVCEAAVGALSGRRIAWTTPVVDHRTHGVLTCTQVQSTCAIAGLNAGANPRDDTYAIVWKPLLLSEVPSSGTPGSIAIDEGTNPDPARLGIEIPTPDPATQGRSFILIKGVEVGRVREAPPSCFCR